MRKILVLGATYGLLFTSKLLLAGYPVKLVCRDTEAKLINERGLVVRMPVRGRDGLVEVDSARLAGELSASVPEGVDPGDYDLAVLAVQEPLFASPGLREFTQALARAAVPCLSIMNMPPLPFLARIPGLDVEAIRGCYREPELWRDFHPGLVTACSPDPQAFRPPGADDNVLEVGLPTNFKAAAFDSDAHTAVLRELEAAIAAGRLPTSDGSVDLPVKLRVHASTFVPLAKWSMLIAGNYRCIQDDGMRSIRDAVYSDLRASREIYDWVGDVCKSLGADAADLVPFDKYAEAAALLTRPSSAARTLFSGAPHLERVDLLIQTLAAQKGMQYDPVDEIVARVQARLETNRAAVGQTP